MSNWVDIGEWYELADGEAPYPGLSDLFRTGVLLGGFDTDDLYFESITFHRLDFKLLPTFPSDSLVTGVRLVLSARDTAQGMWRWITFRGDGSYDNYAIDETTNLEFDLILPDSEPNSIEDALISFENDGTWGENGHVVLSVLAQGTGSFFSAVTQEKWTSYIGTREVMR